MPVVKGKDDPTLIGVLSKKDAKKAGTYVKDVMSTPPIAARPDIKVADAAVMMLKHKVSTRHQFVLTLWKQPAAKVQLFPTATTARFDSEAVGR